MNEYTFVVSAKFMSTVIAETEDEARSSAIEMLDWSNGFEFFIDNLEEVVNLDDDDEGEENED